jgi:hypothetical protein
MSFAKSAVLLVAFVVYMATFAIDHPWNYQYADYFLRNRLLLFIASDSLVKVLSFAAIAYSILSIWTTELARPSYYLLYPVTAVLVASSWLIEQRYYIVPLCLFILFRKDSHRIVDIMTGVMYVAADCVVIGLVNI